MCSTSVTEPNVRKLYHGLTLSLLTADDKILAMSLHMFTCKRDTYLASKLNNIWKSVCDSIYREKIDTTSLNLLVLNYYKLLLVISVYFRLLSQPLM